MCAEKSLKFNNSLGDYNLNNSDYDDAVFQVLGFLCSIVLQISVSKELMKPPSFITLLVSHSTSDVIWCLFIVGDGVAAVSSLVDYLDRYLSSERPFQVVVVWTLH